MKINEPNRIGAINSYQRNIENALQGESKKTRRKDEVTISPEAMELLKTNESNTDSARIERIAELKSQVESGTYNVDVGKLAEKLVPYFKTYTKE
ncbi:flagellar biosynthesis anti-sigma factor FlgM [Paenibacillus sp. ACRRY]|uniref:flagellar biosynthesis anti-sigma factor FlgM n=1 Tax=Paenibacillus sp. ACRRY TaxID=2918208 RepID=UPI001EF74A3E|nr:flagellar biosynthesis anti-sigma factor FlgM [Paenibacillus sp. ACRRY]MCG7384090.1 flagellar biosynthesis anti-sigma factor FlgM [Paenibacillus sp. ACRRY]